MSEAVRLPDGQLHQHLPGGPPCVCRGVTTPRQREDLYRMAAWYADTQIAAGLDPVAALVSIADREAAAALITAQPEDPIAVPATPAAASEGGAG